MKEIMRIVDDNRGANIMAFHPQGSKPRPRHQRGELKKSARSPVVDLPEALYDPEWLARQTPDDRHLLNPTRPEWKWVELVRRD